MLEGNPKVAALQSNIAYFVQGAKRRGFDTCLAKETAIVPILVGEDNDAYALSTRGCCSAAFSCRPRYTRRYRGARRGCVSA